VQWQHLQFTRNFYGLLLNSFNDLDNQIHGCLFTDNQFGISNPHGNFYMMQTRFERNNITDVFNGGSGCNSGSIWRSVSVNSSSFVIDGGWCGVGQPLKIHDCRVEGWGGKGGAAVAASIGMATALPAIAQVWRGPLTVVDTEFVPADTSLPHAAVGSWSAETSKRFLNAAGAVLNQVGPRAALPNETWTEDWARTFLFSNNKLRGAGVFLEPMPNDVSYNLSKGDATASPISARTTFMPESWPLVTKVFDVVRDFGALGNGSVSDTPKIQACADAAGAYRGPGVASCYLRPGRFDVNRTIVLTGRDFVFEGSGSGTHLVGVMLGEHENDTTLLISATHAENITVQQMAIESKRTVAPMTMGPPDGDGKPRTVHIDFVGLGEGCGGGTPPYIYGTGFSSACFTGLLLHNLSQTDTVRIGGIAAPISLIGSGAATVLTSFHYASYTTVATVGEPHGPQVATTSGRGAGQRVKGFAGELVKVPASGIDFGLVVRDSESFVVGDFYLEGGGQIVYLSGAEGDEATGVVTMSNVKHTVNLNSLTSVHNNTFIEIEHYRGLFAHTQAVWMQSTPLADMGGGKVPADLPFGVNHVGTEPVNYNHNLCSQTRYFIAIVSQVDLLFFGESFCDTVPVFNLSSGANLSLVGNSLASVETGQCGGGPQTPVIVDYCKAVAPNYDNCVLADKQSNREYSCYTAG
jgi:hypothetical protein